MTISKRKLESYKRAELFCREMRHLMAGNYPLYNEMGDEAVKMLISWMRVTGKIKYVRPCHENAKQEIKHQPEVGNDKGKSS